MNLEFIIQPPTSTPLLILGDVGLYRMHNFQSYLIEEVLLSDMN